MTDIVKLVIDNSRPDCENIKKMFQHMLDSVDNKEYGEMEKVVCVVKTKEGEYISFAWGDIQHPSEAYWLLTKGQQLLLD